MNYPYRVFQTNVEGHVFWVAESEYLTGCIGQGDTIEDAVSTLAGNENEWLETANELQIPIPSVKAEALKEYSGKLTLRVSPSVHRNAAKNAKQEGISLNQYLNDAIVAYNAELSTGHIVTEKLKEVIHELRSLISAGRTISESTQPAFWSLNLSAPQKCEIAFIGRS